MVSPRTASLVSLGAIPAMVSYALLKDPIVGISVLNVCIIATSLYLAFSPVDDAGHAHTSHA